MIVEFTDLATEGLQTPQPLWMQKEELPEWARRRKEAWVQFEHSDDKLSGNNDVRRTKMTEALVASVPAKKR